MLILFLNPKQFKMKKTLFLSFVLLILSISNYAEDYIVIKFKDPSKVATKSVVGNNIFIKFKDPKLVNAIASL